MGNLAPFLRVIRDAQGTSSETLKFRIGRPRRRGRGAPVGGGHGEALGGQSVASPRVWRKNPSRPRGPPGPRPTRGGGLGRRFGATARCLPPRKCPFPDPTTPTRATHPAPFPPLRAHPPPPLQAPGAASASAGPPRTAPPDDLHAPTPWVTPGRPWAPASGHAIRRAAPGSLRLGSVQAPPSAPAPLGCPGSRDRAPAALSKLIPGQGGAPGIIPLRAVAPGRVTWTCVARRL